MPLLRIVLLACLLVVVSGGVVESAGERPNIVLMMADDMGFSDLGCYGGEIATPHLDALAAGGLRFTRFYNTGRCCPTRAALLTGLYPHQAGVGHMTGDLGSPAYQGHLNDVCVTIGEALRPSGYQTLAVGKWHVGSKQPQWPLQRGFDRYFGTPAGGGFYFREALDFRKGFVTLGNERVEYPEEAYVTDLFTDHALEFVDEAAQREQPFFLYFAHIAPHWPLQAKPEDIARYADRYTRGWEAVRRERYERQRKLGLIDESWALSPIDAEAQQWEQLAPAAKADLAHRMAVYAAQIDCIDQNVGRLVARLKELGEFDNTLFLFLSDNGCSAEGGPGGFRRNDASAPIGSPASYASAGLEWANVCNTPFRKFKMDTYEGGIASPLIVHWPQGVARRGEFERQMGHVIDLLPTCLAAVGVEAPQEHRGRALQPLAGVSLLPAFAGEDIPREPLFWEHQGNRAVRDGDWKLVAAHQQAWELYDLAADPTELHDLAQTHPDRVRELEAQWKNWADAVGVEPWPVRKNR